jgi:hypothetical protein
MERIVVARMVAVQIVVVRIEVRKEVVARMVMLKPGAPVLSAPFLAPRRPVWRPCHEQAHARFRHRELLL